MVATDLGPRSVLQDAWSTGRAERAERKAPAPIVVKVVRWAATRLPSWRGVRTFVYTATGLGLVDYAVWSAHHLAGYAVAGVSLLWLEYAGRRP